MKNLMKTLIAAAALAGTFAVATLPARALVEIDVNKGNVEPLPIAVTDFLFKQPISVGDIVSFYAEIVKVGRTSITVDVQVFAERNPTSPVVVKVTEAQFTYVAINEDGSNGKTEVFADGWLLDTGEYAGRPVSVTQLGDGSLLVSDDLVGAIYRISYDGK